MAPRKSTASAPTTVPPAAAKGKKSAAEKEAERKAKAAAMQERRKKAAEEKARRDAELGPDSEDEGVPAPKAKDVPNPAVASVEEEEDIDDDELQALEGSIGRKDLQSDGEELLQDVFADDDDTFGGAGPRTSPAPSDMDEDNEPFVTESNVPLTPRKRKNAPRVPASSISTPPRKKSNGKVTNSLFSPNGAAANDISKNYTTANILMNNAYPSQLERSGFYLNSVKEGVFGPVGSEAMQRSYNKFLEQVDYGKKAVIMQEYAGQAVKSKFVTAARAFVAGWLPIYHPDPKVAQALTMARTAECKATSCYLFGNLSFEPTTTWDKMLLTQGSMYEGLVHSYLFVNRGKHDVEAFRRIIERQRVNNAMMALCGAAVGHCVDEWVDGYFVKKPFTSAAAVEYNIILTRLNSWEAAYPHLTYNWQSKMFREACDKANKSWLYTQVIAEDDEETTTLLRQAEAAARATSSQS